MKKITLNNKLKIILYPKKTQTTTIAVHIKVGSNNESKSVLGISHFIEHMLFEGTSTRSSLQIASEIEKIGGELNAATSNERTFFYAQVPNKHIKTAVEILADILQNPLFQTSKIEKERKVITNEIKLITDEPRFHQWILFTKVLFQNNPAKNPVYGSEATVKNIKKSQLLNYYKKYYNANNIFITIIGNTNCLNLIKKHFSKLKPKQTPKVKINKEPPQIKKTLKEKKQILQSYIVLGYKTPTRLNKETYALDLLENILGYGQSSKLFTTIRNKYGLVYEIGLEHESKKDYGFFAAYANTNKKNIQKVISLILREFNNIQDLTEKELQQAKTSIEGLFKLTSDNPQKLSDLIGYWETIKDSNLAGTYIEEIKKVTLKELKQTAKKYLTNNYTLSIITN